MRTTESFNNSGPGTCKMKPRMEGDVMGSVKMMSLMAPKPASKQAGKDSKGQITDDDDSDAQAMWQMNVKVTSWALTTTKNAVKT